MNKDHSCDIIQDLLPGYIDGILSEAGTDLVKRDWAKKRNKKKHLRLTALRRCSSIQKN